MSAPVIVNAVLFQIVWFACVVGGGSYGWFWPGVLATLALVLSVRHSDTARHDVLLAIVLTPAGWLMDTLWIQLGVLDFFGASVAPFWIVLLWLGLALTVHHSLVFFRERPLVGAVAVMLTAPVSYLAGERLGAVIVPHPLSLGYISLTWGLFFYAVFRLSCGALPAWSETAADH